MDHRQPDPRLATAACLFVVLGEPPMPENLGGWGSAPGRLVLLLWPSASSPEEFLGEEKRQGELRPVL